MVFIETSYFTRQVAELLSDEEYADFQIHLAAAPTVGEMIQGTGGLRKVRWMASGKGKSGGVRVIYYYATAASQLRMLVIYKKGVKDDLTAVERKQLKQLNDNWG